MIYAEPAKSLPVGAYLCGDTPSPTALMQTDYAFDLENRIVLSAGVRARLCQDGRPGVIYGDPARWRVQAIERRRVLRKNGIGGRWWSPALSRRLL